VVVVVEFVTLLIVVLFATILVVVGEVVVFNVLVGDD
jgi:hypothetical protein